MLKAVVIMFSSCHDAHSAELSNSMSSMCLSSDDFTFEMFLSLQGQVYPKMLMFISVGLIRISIGLSKTHQYKSAPEMFISDFKSHHTGHKSLTHPRKTIN